jgi:hypothetical protein
MFTETYRPRKLDDFIGNKSVIQPFIKWLLTWEPTNKKTKCALVSGLCGIGKTLLVELICNKYDYNIINLSIDEERNKDFITNIKRLYDNYAGMFPNLNAFKEVFEQLTKDFGCMVIVNRGARASFLEKIYYYKAPVLPDDKVKIGCKQFNRYHEKNFNVEWRKKINRTFDIAEYCNKHKKEKSAIKVDKKEIGGEGEKKFSLYANQDPGIKSLVQTEKNDGFFKKSFH